jgi:hypothetical protein
VAGLHALARRPSEASRAVRVRGELVDGAGERDRVRGRDQQSGDTVLDDLQELADAGGDHGKCGGAVLVDLEG